MSATANIYLQKYLFELVYLQINYSINYNSPVTRVSYVIPRISMVYIPYRLICGAVFGIQALKSFKFRYYIVVFVQSTNIASIN